MKNKKIILLGGKGQSTNAVFNVLNKEYDVIPIIEEKESLIVFLKRRIKRLGIITVVGQIIFQLVVPKLLTHFSKKRSEEIIKNNKINFSPIPSESINKVSSVNAQSTIEFIKKINPDLIIVNGTRIISKKVLQSANCKFINTHVGITPMYRGVHGTYWALVNNDPENSGVTVHFVDEGIDTGNIIMQKQVNITSEDNFSTYPLLQLSFGIKILVEAVENYFSENIAVLTKEGDSKLYYHPTIWEYLYYRIARRVK